MSKLQDKLEQFIQYPTEQDILFDLGWEYETIGQTAAAVSFYLRTCEFGNNIDLHYESLLRISICFGKQGERRWIQRGFILRAISLLPKRPEGYYLLSQHYREGRDWQETYTTACMGLVNGTEKPNTISHLGYDNKCNLLYMKGFGALMIGLFDESNEIYNNLLHEKSISPLYLEHLRNELEINNI